MRDKLQDKAYFDKWIDWTTKRIAKVKGDLNELSSNGKAISSAEIVEYDYDILSSRYCRGDLLLDIFPSVQQGMDGLKIRRNILYSVKNDLKPSEYEMWDRLDLGRLFEFLTIFSFMVALRFPKEEIVESLEQIGHEGKDVLLDMVATYVGQGKGVKKSAYPKVYGNLTTLIFADKEKQPLLLKHCVNNWYESMKPIYWYDSHEGGEGAYVGYWCFDIALVVMLLDIDDSLVQDHPHYPADLAKHYRATK